MSHHYALVRPSGRKGVLREHKGAVRRRWKRHIILIDIAAFSARGFCPFDQQMAIFDMLIYHRRSPTAIYGIAKVMRAVLKNEGTLDKRSLINDGTRNYEELQSKADGLDDATNAEWSDDILSPF